MRHTHSPPLLLLLALTALLVLTAASCANEVALAPTSGDDVVEVFVSQQTIAETYTEEGEFVVSPVLSVATGATRVGVMLDLERSDGAVHIEARGVARGGQVGDWVALETTWGEDVVRVARADLGMAAYGAQLRVASSSLPQLRSFNWSALVPVPAEVHTQGRADEVRTIDQHLEQVFTDYGVRPRADWNARATQCTDENRDKHRIAVHHTVTPISEGSYETRIRGIQSYHMDTRGWCDVGYHFLVTSDGTVWEAREIRFLGTHVGGNNTGNVGVSWIGCFHTSGCNDWTPFEPPEVMIEGGAGVIGVIADLYGIDINAQTVKGHRDHDGATSSCPGDNLHARLDDIRRLAGEDGGPIEDPKGSIKGVIFDRMVTEGPSDDGNVRLTEGSISCSCNNDTLDPVSPQSAYFEYAVPPGTYTLTANAPGYAPSSAEVTVVAGMETWNSIGLLPEATEARLTILVNEVIDGANTPVADATVEVTGADPRTTNVDGTVELSLMPGAVSVSISKEGYTPATGDLELVEGANDETFELVRTMVDPGENNNPGENNDPGTNNGNNGNNENNSTGENNNVDPGENNANPNNSTGGPNNNIDPNPNNSGGAVNNGAGENPGEMPPPPAPAQVNDSCSAAPGSGAPSRPVGVLLLMAALGGGIVLLRRRV